MIFFTFRGCYTRKLLLRFIHSEDELCFLLFPCFFVYDCGSRCGD